MNCKSIGTLATILIIALSLATFGLILSVLSDWSQYIWTAHTLILLLVLPSALLSVMILAFVRGAETRLKVALCVFFSGIALYMGELLIIVAGPYVTLPSEFDRRTKLEVVLDMRKQGSYAYPSVHPKNVIDTPILVSGREILPLAGVARATTVFCNEVGSYYIYQSDEIGFTNPTGLYSQEIDLALVGDSFTQGFCAPHGTSYAERIRAVLPRTLNLGNNGNGPLLELATMREILPQTKPKVVFWLYFEGNDMEDLSRELLQPTLKRYLEEPSFRQDIFGQAKTFDLALKGFVETNITQQLKRTWVDRLIEGFPEQFRLWTRLWHIRQLIGLSDLKRQWPLHRWNHKVSDSEVSLAFGRIITQAKNLVESWSGDLVFVYLPSYRTYGYEIKHPWRDRVLQHISEQQIKIIDFVPIFGALPDPVSLFNFRKEAHYTEFGNELVARTILKYLERSDKNVVPGLLPVASSDFPADAG